MRIFCICSLLSFLLLSGCSGISTVTLANAPAKPEDCTMKLIGSESEVGRKFETLCFVETGTSYGLIADASGEYAIKRAVPALCACGADAAIIIEAADSTASAWTQTLFSAPRQGTAKLKGIRFLD